MQILRQRIAESYPQLEAKIRELEEKRIVTPTDDYDEVELHILRGISRKPGRPTDIGFDDAYQNILDGMDMETAFDKYLCTVELPMPGDWNNFRRAMNRRKKRSKRYE